MYSIQEQMYMYPHTSWGRNARVWSLVPDLKKEKPKCPKRNDMKEDNEMRGLRMRGSKTSLGVVPLDVEDTLVEVAVREIAEKTGGHVEITRATGGAWREVVSMLFFFFCWTVDYLHSSTTVAKASFWVAAFQAQICLLQTELSYWAEFIATMLKATNISECLQTRQRRGELTSHCRWYWNRKHRDR